MLGWGIIIYKQNEPEKGNWKDCIAHWEAGLDGIDWIKENCEMIARNSGYPVKFETNGKFIKKMLKDGPVKYSPSSDIIHEEEGLVELVGKSGWIGSPRIDLEELNMLDDNESIIIDAWDLS